MKNKEGERNAKSPQVQRLYLSLSVLIRVHPWPLWLLPPSQSTIPLPRKIWFIVQTVAFGVSFAVTLSLSPAAADELAASLSGTVVDADGKPAAGATVVVAEGPPALRFMKRLANTAAPEAPKTLASVRVDDAGKFTIALPEEVPEFSWRRTRLAVWAYQPDCALAVRLIDRDWPRAGLPLAIELRRGVAAKLKIIDAHGQSVAGARVRPRRVAGQPVPDAIAEQLVAMADAEGLVIVGGPAASDLDAVIVDSPASGRQWAGLPRLLGDGPATIALAPLGKLSGQLSADDPRAVRQRKLRFATWLEPGDETAGGGLADAVTDDDGKFEVPAIAAGSLTFELLEDGPPGPSPNGPSPKNVTARKPERAGTPEKPVYLSVQHSGPQVDPGTTTRFEIPLRHAVAVTQEVRDRDDGSPIAGVRVSLTRGAAGDRIVTTDKSGRFVCHLLPGHVAPVPTRIPRPYYFPRYTLDSQTIPDDSDSIILNPMRLARGGAVRGRVVDNARRPVVDAEVFGVWQLPPRGEERCHAWSDEHGEFSIEGVASDAELRLWAVKGELLVSEPVLARPAGEPVTLVAEPGRTVSIECRMVNAAGKPVSGAHVRVWAGERGKSPSGGSLDLGSVIFDGDDRVRTDAEGRFRTPRRLPAKLIYSLEIEAPGMSPTATETLQPTTAQTGRFADVVMYPVPRLRTVAGRVVGRQGRPIAGALVWQSGDGPRRTETISGEDGRFQLAGVYTGPAFLFAKSEGYAHGGAMLAASDDNGFEIVLRRTDEQGRSMSTLPASVPLEEQRKLAMSLIEPSLPMVRDAVFKREHYELLRIVGRADPQRALDIADAILTNPDIQDMARQSAAAALAETDLDEAAAIAGLLRQPRLRAQVYLQAWDASRHQSRAPKSALLDEALIQARAEPEVAQKVYVLGKIADRWLDAGQRDRATALLREAQVFAQQLPDPSEATQRDNAVHLRARFAGTLARIDGPTALRMVEGFGKPYADWYRANVARGLADHDPAEAERIFNLIELPGLRFAYGLAALHRLAATDADRAERLARKYPEAVQQAYGLGFVAHNLAGTDRAAARRLLGEAFDLFERVRQTGEARNSNQTAAVAAAGLLPVVERIDPTLVEEYLWRTLALRAPGRARADPLDKAGLARAELAALIARYDHAAARHLVTPISERLREATAQVETYHGMVSRVFMPLAAIDARWACELVRSLPETPVQAAQSHKQTSARLLADWLARPPGDFWTTVYMYTGLRDPEGSDEVP